MGQRQAESQTAALANWVAEAQTRNSHWAENAREHVALCRQRAALVAVPLEEALACGISSCGVQRIKNTRECSARQQ